MTEGRTSIHGAAMYVRLARANARAVDGPGDYASQMRRPRAAAPCASGEAILTKCSIFRNKICYFSRQTNGIIHIGFLYAVSTFKKEA